MPQIAQQDYIVIKPKKGRAANVDAECLRRLKQACENGTIFDCIIYEPTVAEESDFSRVIAGYDISILLYSAGDTEIVSIEFPYTVTQYQGLAAVQEAEDEYSGGVEEVLPSLSLVLGGYLNEDNEGIPICVNGFRLSVTAPDGTIAALEISDTKPAEGEDFINIAWEDALKLIGLPIS